MPPLIQPQIALDIFSRYNFLFIPIKLELEPPPVATIHVAIKSCFPPCNSVFAQLVFCLFYCKDDLLCNPTWVAKYYASMSESQA